MDDGLGSIGKTSMPSLVNHRGIDFDKPLPPEYFAKLVSYSKSVDNIELGNPSTPFYGRLRILSLQHICQELDDLNTKLEHSLNPTWHDLERLRYLLHEHAKAMKDLEYFNEHLVGVPEWRYISQMDKLATHNLTQTSADFTTWLYCSPHKSYIVSQLQKFLQRILPSFLSWSSHEKKAQSHYYRKGYSPTTISLPVRILSGIIVSLCSAASIVVPVVVMSFDPSRNKNLIVVGTAVSLFGFVLAVGLGARSEVVFVATATYAAVLVVFLGASGGNSG